MQISRPDLDVAPSGIDIRKAWIDFQRLAEVLDGTSQISLNGLGYA